MQIHLSQGQETEFIWSGLIKDQSETMHNILHVVAYETIKMY